MRVPEGRCGLPLRSGDGDATRLPERRLSNAACRCNSASSLACALSFTLACILAARGPRLVIGPKSSDEDGGRRVRDERVVGVLGEAAGFLLLLERTVVTALRFFGAGGVSDSSSERTAGRLGLGLVGARLRFRLRGGFGMSRWIQRRSADNKGLTRSRDCRALSNTYTQ